MEDLFCSVQKALILLLSRQKTKKQKCQSFVCSRTKAAFFLSIPSFSDSGVLLSPRNRPKDSCMDGLNLATLRPWVAVSKLILLSTLHPKYYEALGFRSLRNVDDDRLLRWKDFPLCSISAFEPYFFHFM